MAQKGGAIFLSLFGLAFLTVGVGAGYYSGHILMRAEAMRTWSETPATVVSCTLSVSRGSKGGASYQAKATYRYDVNGVCYTGDRVSLHAGHDNIGRFQKRTYAELKRAMDRKQATVCWVNPQNAADVILFRTPRPEMLVFMQLFVLAFGGVGLGIVLAGLTALFQPSENTESPFGQAQIRMRGASSHRVAGTLALVWNGYVGWLLWKSSVVFGLGAMPWYLWLLAATGVAPAVIAGYLIGRFRKFGVSVFEMSPMPGVLGGPVSGTIRIPAKVETEDGFEIVLQCIHQYTTRSGKNSTTHRDVLWEDARHIDGSQAYGDETMLPVRFSVPYERPATTVAGGRNGYYWRLNATAAAPGIDYKAVFDVPVRHTPQSSQTFAQPQAAAVTAAALQERVETLVSRNALRLEPHSDGGFELVFPAGRSWSAALLLALFLAGWTAACVVLWTVAKAPVFMTAVFTLFDALMMLLLVNMLLLSRGIVVDRVRRECVLWWRIAGGAKHERRVPFDQILEFRSERSSQSGNTVYYRVALAVDGGMPATVGSGIRMWNDAERVARLLEAAVGPAFNLEGYRL